MTHPAKVVGSAARDRASRGEIAVHDHVCGMYESRQEQYEAACRFLAAGLTRKERCMYIAEHDSPAEFMAFLDAHGVDVKAATLDGSLQVVSGKDVRLALGGFTPSGMLSWLAQAEKKALESGFVAFRWGADMTWLRKDNIEPAELFVFEAALTDALRTHELVGLCQYAMEDFKSEFLIAAAETHPLLVYNKLACDNFYYIPAEEFLKPRFSDLKLKRMLFNIITREQLMREFLA